MTTFDVVVYSILGLSVIFSLFKGFVKEIGLRTEMSVIFVPSELERQEGLGKDDVLLKMALKSDEMLYSLKDDSIIFEKVDNERLNAESRKIKLQVFGAASIVSILLVYNGFQLLLLSGEPQRKEEQLGKS